MFRPWLQYSGISCLSEGCVKSVGHFRGYKNMKLLFPYRPSDSNSPHFQEPFIEAPLQWDVATTATMRQAVAVGNCC